MPEELFPGFEVETVADIIGDKAAPPAEPVLPARHPHMPEFPTPGIYFGMDEAVYHSIEACSSSRLKKLSVSSMDAWADSALNLERVDDETEFKMLGRAYHARICEGHDAYVSRYAVALDKRDFPRLIVSTEELQAAIIEAGGTPVTRIETGQFKEHARTKAQLPVTRAARKEDLVTQLTVLDPSAPIWDVLEAQHLQANHGKFMIPAAQHKRILIAAKMIENHPELCKAFTGGHAEVSIFWHDEATGCPMKARLDYLKTKAIVDLKSFSNPLGRPVDRAIDFTIANHKHFIGAVVYQEAVAAAKRMIRERGPDAIGINYDPDDPDIHAFCERLAAERDHPTCLWVYQQTGHAPVTRGRVHPRGTTHMITADAVKRMKARYVELTRTYGTDPWLDIAPISQTTDEDLPMSATDL